jgi:hypothetical protein
MNFFTIQVLKDRQNLGTFKNCFNVCRVSGVLMFTQIYNNEPLVHRYPDFDITLMVYAE